jgi:RNA-binding motif X-linked protein 2
MNQVKFVESLNKRELAAAAKSGGVWDVKGSWHEKYKHSAYVFVAGFAFEMTEGDLVVVFSQFGEVLDVNLARDKKTGKSRGFAFLAYEDQRSTVLAVDNMNGTKLLGRTLRVDHCENYGEEQERASKVEDVQELTPEEREKEAERLAHNEAVRSRRDAKSAMFALERGVLSDEQAALAQAVAEATRQREAAEREARERQRARIEATRLAHRGAADAEMGEEAKREREFKLKRAARDEAKKLEAKQGATGDLALRGVVGLAPPPLDGMPRDAPRDAPRSGDAEARFARMFGGKVKKAKKRAPERAEAAHEARPAKRPGEDSASIAETNAMRAQLGLPPLRP